MNQRLIDEQYDEACWEWAYIQHYHIEYWGLKW